MTELFLRETIKDIVQIHPRQLNSNYKKTILKKLNDEYSGKCSKFGYIKVNSINIQDIYEGEVEKSRFIGNVRFDVSFSALICQLPSNNMPKKVIIKAHIQGIIDFGIVCIVDYFEETMGKKIDFITVFVPNDSLTIKSEEDVSKLKVGDEVYVEILDSCPELYSLQITTIGRIVKKPKSIYKSLVEGFANDSQFSISKNADLFNDDERSQRIKQILDDEISDDNNEFSQFNENLQHHHDNRNEDDSDEEDHSSDEGEGDDNDSDDDKKKYSKNMKMKSKKSHNVGEDDVDEIDENNPEDDGDDENEEDIPPDIVEMNLEDGDIDNESDLGEVSE
jgi:DNA-directed RNA polymerase subunit E'/Rpb7